MVEDPVLDTERIGCWLQSTIRWLERTSVRQWQSERQRRDAFMYIMYIKEEIAFMYIMYIRDFRYGATGAEILLLWKSQLMGRGLGELPSRLHPSVEAPAHAMGARHSPIDVPEVRSGYRAPEA